MEESIADSVIQALGTPIQHLHQQHPYSDELDNVADRQEESLEKRIKISLNPLKIDKPLKLHHTTRCSVTNIPINRTLIPQKWQEMLTSYTDRQWAYRLVHDIIYGVNIGYTGSRKQTISKTSTKPTTDKAQSDAIQQDIQKEIGVGRMIGPYIKSPFKHYHSSPIFTVAKKGIPGKLRVVHNLSYPRKKLNQSVNSCIVEWPCILGQFNQAVKIVCQLGKGCHMAKMDIKAAYRLIAVRPVDWPLLAFTWKDSIYFHTALPFGLKSSCHLWERYATAANWMLRQLLKIPTIMHYVDDWFMAETTSSKCRETMNQVDHLFNDLGLTIASEKTAGPTTKLTFLGIQINSEDMSISIDQERVDSITTLLHTWQQRKTCSLKQLQSLIGVLSFASCVVAHGRTFVHHLRTLMQQHLDTDQNTDESSINISTEAHEDIQWWLKFMNKWNGISLLWEQEWLLDTDIIQPHTDACTEGYGALCGRQWFHGRWTEEQQQWSVDGTTSRESMPFKELYALVAAATTWGHLWTRKRITFRTDCEPVVWALNKGTSRSRRMMQLIHVLHYHAAQHHYQYRAVHIPGVDNTIADELSRVHSMSQLSQECRLNIDLLQTTPVLPIIPI